MALESLVVEQWLYSTLVADTALAALLAPENAPDKYQQGVYSLVAPDIDPISGVRPEVPFVVFAMDSGVDNERSLDGSRATTDLRYRITVWDNSSNSASIARASAIMSRVDELLDNVSSATTPKFWTRRDSVAQQFRVRAGGTTDSGVTATYMFTVGQ
jgi:hypothetical protein